MILSSVFNIVGGDDTARECLIGMDTSGQWSPSVLSCSLEAHIATRERPSGRGCSITRERSERAISYTTKRS